MEVFETLEKRIEELQQHKNSLVATLEAQCVPDVSTQDSLSQLLQKLRSYLGIENVVVELNDNQSDSLAKKIEDLILYKHELVNTINAEMDIANINDSLDLLRKKIHLLKATPEGITELNHTRVAKDAKYVLASDYKENPYDSTMKYTGSSSGTTDFPSTAASLGDTYIYEGYLYRLIDYVVLDKVTIRGWEVINILKGNTNPILESIRGFNVISANKCFLEGTVHSVSCKSEYARTCGETLPRLPRTLLTARFCFWSNEQLNSILTLEEGTKYIDYLNSVLSNGIVDCANMFAHCSDPHHNTGLGNDNSKLKVSINTSSITSTFYNCHTIRSMELTLGPAVSYVYNLLGNCTHLKHLDLTVNTSKLTYCTGIFGGAAGGEDLLPRDATINIYGNDSNVAYLKEKIMDVYEQKNFTKITVYNGTEIYSSLVTK